MPLTILNDLMRLAGEPDADADVRFAGADPVFPTPFRIGDFGAAAIAAGAVQAARLHEQAGGPHQRVRVDVDAAAIAMRSSRYIRLDPPGPNLRSGKHVGFYPTADDRWVFLQRLFPHHLERQLAVLGCDRAEPAIAAAIRTWKGAELEDAITANGACGALVRSHAEWAGLEQSVAVASLPLFEITRIGDSDPEPVPSGDRPLSGLRVLDVTRVLAGPLCARTLAEHGADVLRVGSAAVPDAPEMVRDTGHGKRSCVLDLKSAVGTAVLRDLVRDADVFAQGYRPGSLARLGFSPEELARVRPGIICVSISAFGRTGPWRERRGFDSVVQSVSGICAELTDPAGTPRALPANPLDYTTGYLAAFLVLVALGRRAREGGSYHVQLSLAQTGRYLDELGRADPDAVAARPADLPPERIEELMVSRDTPYGRLRYFAPVARLPSTPARWDHPTVPVDHDDPVWT